jgi:uncharacterized lipoprotein YddW (UPF0748 family)
MSDKQRSGCGCANIPISFVFLIAGAGYWWLIHLGNFNKLWSQAQAMWMPTPQPVQVRPSPSISPSVAPEAAPKIASASPIAVQSSKTQAPETQTAKTQAAKTPSPSGQSSQTAATPSISPVSSLAKSTASSPVATPQTVTAWEKKAIRGIYLSRYQVTNNADEQTIRDRVRYYKRQGFNTIIHGVWGNGCTMYNSIIMQQTLGFKSCPNLFQDQWLDWMLDEAQKQGMQVHAYFEKGIKIDKNSPIFELAKSRKWLVPGVDKTYPSVEHYVLDVEIPEVANLFRQISSEFVRKYPKINAVQWDDYLGYHAELPGKVDRTAHLSQFVLQMRADLKKSNPSVSFDVCHHNPYWAKRYFAADWGAWKVDRAFIQVYNDKNFQDELHYLEKYQGVAISEAQLHRLPNLVKNSRINAILIFPMNGNPEQAATLTQAKVAAIGN